MFKNKKVSLILSILASTLAFGLMAFLPVETASVLGAVKSHGRRPGPEKDHAFLADALGISEAELQAAVVEAQTAALDQALEDGLITQEQADAIAARGFRLPRGIGGPDSGIDFDALLADALGITAEDLAAARDSARDAALQQALADGLITEEQVALIEARDAFRNAMPKHEILAKALGISLEELETAKDDGIRVPDLLEELGITPADFEAKLNSAWEQVVQDAVDDGILTQEQADLLLADGFQGMPHPGGPGHHGHPGEPKLPGCRPEGQPGGQLPAQTYGGA